MPSATRFNYRSLGRKESLVRAATERIRQGDGRANDRLVAVGLELIAIKGMLEFGQFVAWVRQEFDWSHSTACNYMRVAERFADDCRRERFSANALYLLASPLVPEAARDEAKARAARGEKITWNKAADIRNRHRAERTASSCNDVQPSHVASTTPLAEPQPRDEANALRDAVEAVLHRLIAAWPMEDWEKLATWWNSWRRQFQKGKSRCKR